MCKNEEPQDQDLSLEEITGNLCDITVNFFEQAYSFLDNYKKNHPDNI